MQGTIGEVRMFAANFAPMNWALCSGQLLPIAQNTALFSIIGTFYGGDGIRTFGLPDLRGRTTVGAGQGQGLSFYDVGEVTGTESVTILTGNLPAHNHIPTVVPGGAGSGTLTLNGVNGTAGQLSPGGNLLGQDSAQTVSMYASSGTTSPINAASVTVTNVSGPQLSTLTLAPTGGNLPHENRQPLLAVNYIICLSGTFPVRN
jgi:microcystin-dependent protein